MSHETTFPPDNLVPPAGFIFNPDLLMDYDDQVRRAVLEAAYQSAPLPSFQEVPVLDIKPAFNPTHAPVEEIYARNRVPTQLRELGTKVRSEWEDTNAPVIMWRIVERAKLEDGTGLVSSSILQKNSLGNVEEFSPIKHLLSHDQGRMSNPDAATPFISFSTDPQNLATDVILKHGFGIKDGRDSVVVQVQVDPGRVLTGPGKKDPEVLLLGGVAPDEYVAAYSVEDFINNVVPEGEVTVIRGDVVSRDQALGYWALRDR